MRLTSATASSAVPTVVPVPAARRNRCGWESVGLIVFGVDVGGWKRWAMSRTAKTVPLMIAPVVAPRRAEKSETC
ncbi:hypothetical protein N0V93_006211 [Gnomoniopsis smithogilvyi]|uniref:Uncharacterized protein n=1 Tax=Gnomoniopsis smithogilvyi TaxID=1191159 RepID=A0A9W8YQB9_9PEZI|nr:hypothetical protein N0V93_006211 [Gnomoniopsis smithogilvyi]